MGSGSKKVARQSKSGCPLLFGNENKDDISNLGNAAARIGTACTPVTLLPPAKPS